MSTSTTHSRPSTTRRYIVGLSQVIHNANVFYANIAQMIRATHRPTFHAKLHAKRLGLRVDTDKAVNLAQKYVSTIALPIVTQYISPIATVHRLDSIEGKCFNGPTALELRNLDAVLSLLSESKLAQQNFRTDLGNDLMYPYATPPAWNENLSVAGSSRTSAASTLLSTPGNNQEMPLKIRIKRKVQAIEENNDSVDKRPKYARKGWVDGIGSYNLRSRGIIC